MLGLVPLAVGLAVVFVAGLVQGTLGFGFSLVTVPILVLFLAPKVTVPVMLVLSTFLNLLLYREVRTTANLRRLLPLMFAGIVGLPIGTYLLVSLDVGLLKTVIGCLVALSGLAFLAGFERPIRRETLGMVAAGITSGVLNGVTSASGPPVILFLANQGMARDTFRASLIAYFLFLNLATIPIFLVGGLISRTVLAYSGLLLPAMVLGALTGSKLSRRIPERAFRRVALAAVIGAGILSVLSGTGLL
ncbi:MAG TPA: sulfite exporter TauE/SafE family protein [bacterium]|nr:sulfite exporter TauE/SafE family protein [bacterium]